MTTRLDGWALKWWVKTLEGKLKKNEIELRGILLEWAVETRWFIRKAKQIKRHEHLLDKIK